jgi:ribosomal protein L16 Arg81 hydroxylase
MTAVTESLESMSAVPEAPIPTRLEHLVGDPVTFFRDHWAKQPVVMRARADLAGLIDEREMWDELDCGLLVRPYFTIFNEGVRTSISDMSRKRRVAGRELPGYVNPDRIHRDFKAGGTFKFNQAEHWHPRIRALVKGLQPHFRGELGAFVFLSPPGKTAIHAHTDGAHVFVLQVAGLKDWVVGRIDDSSISDSAIHEGEIGEHLRMAFTMRPGDVLYMPHGCPHYATARGPGNSVHLSITVEEPTAGDIANVLLASFMGGPRFAALQQSHHGHPLAERIELLRAALLDHLGQADEAAVLAAATTLRVEHR